MVAIVVQSVVTLFFILSSTFESVLVFSGFVMGLNTFFAVAGVFVLRFRNQGAEGYRTWGYPVTPLIFLGLMAWTLIYILINRPEEGIAGLVIVSVGAVLYVGTERLNREPAA
jgi:APA family basic amino acid/polyamine antiporter